MDIAYLTYFFKVDTIPITHQKKFRIVSLFGSRNILSLSKENILNGDSILDKLHVNEWR